MGLSPAFFLYRLLGDIKEPTHFLQRVWNVAVPCSGLVIVFTAPHLSQLKAKQGQPVYISQIYTHIHTYTHTYKCEGEMHYD